MSASIEERFRSCSSIVQAAILAILAHEEWAADPIGYDIQYYQEDLPRIVAEAIAPWKVH